MLAFGELLNSANDRRVMFVHPLLLPDTEQTRDDEVNTDTSRECDIEHEKDERHVLLHLLHLLVRRRSGGVAVRDLPDRHVLEADGYQHQQRVREDVHEMRLMGSY